MSHGFLVGSCNYISSVLCWRMNECLHISISDSDKGTIDFVCLLLNEAVHFFFHLHFVIDWVKIRWIAPPEQNEIFVSCEDSLRFQEAELTERDSCFL